MPDLSGLKSQVIQVVAGSDPQTSGGGARLHFQDAHGRQTVFGGDDILYLSVFNDIDSVAVCAGIDHTVNFHQGKNAKTDFFCQNRDALIINDVASTV